MTLSFGLKVQPTENLGCRGNKLNRQERDKCWSTTKASLYLAYTAPLKVVNATHSPTVGPLGSP